MSSTQGLVDGNPSAIGSLMGMVSTAKEKWVSSGASDAFGRVQAQIPESTKTYVGSIFRRDQIRSITIVFGIGEERPFYVEKNPSLLMERIRHNLVFFLLNYILLTVVLFLLTLVISPTALIGMALLAAAWMWLIRASASGTLVVGALRVPQKTASIVMGMISVFVLLWLLSGIFWWTLFSSGFLVAIHAFMRDASMHKDLNDAVAMEGDLHYGEDATFLNSKV